MAGLAAPLAHNDNGSGLFQYGTIRTLVLVLSIAGSLVCPAGGADVDDVELYQAESIFDWTSAGTPLGACMTFTAFVRLHDGSYLLSDTKNHAICKLRSPVNSSSKFEIAAGKGKEPGCLDGYGEDARFKRPEYMVLDPSGNVYIADAGNDAIRMLTPQGEVRTIAGQPGCGSTLNSNLVFTEGLGALWYDAATCSVLVMDKGNRTLSNVKVNATCQPHAEPGKHEEDGGDHKHNDDKSQGWLAVMWTVGLYALAAIVGSVLTVVTVKPELSRGIVGAPLGVCRDVQALTGRVSSAARHMAGHMLQPIRGLFLELGTGQSEAASPAQHMVPGITSADPSISELQSINSRQLSPPQGLFRGIGNRLGGLTVAIRGWFDIASWHSGRAPAQHGGHPSLIDFDPPQLPPIIGGRADVAGHADMAYDGLSGTDSTSMYSETLNRFLESPETMPAHSFREVVSGKGHIQEGACPFPEYVSPNRALSGTEQNRSILSETADPESQIQSQGLDTSLHSTRSDLTNVTDASGRRDELQAERKTDPLAPFDFLTKESLEEWGRQKK